jgi:hypothetical protein
MPRLCASAADCESQHPMCCTYAIGQVTVYVCLDAAEQNLLGSTCL